MSVATPSDGGVPLTGNDARAVSSDARQDSIEYGRAGADGKPQEPTYFGLSVSAWVQILILSALFVMLFWPSLRRLWLKTNPFTGEPNWSHAVCVPLVGLYYLYVNRDELFRAKVSPLLVASFSPIHLISSLAMLVFGLVVSYGVTAAGLLPTQSGNLWAMGTALSILGVLALMFNWGVGTLVFGIGFYAYGIHPGQNDYLKDLGLVVTVFGTVLTLCGWQVMRVAWFPIAFLICALPWPGLVYSWVASPLQELAAKVAVVVLQVTGVEAYYYGTKIFIGTGNDARTLNVAEACAGLRSLMTFITVGAAVAFLSSRPLWQKLFITMMAVPIAVFCNVMRVSGQGLLDTYVSYQLSESFAHQFVGMIMLIPAFFMILGLGWVLDKLFVEEVDESQLLAGAGATVGTLIKGEDITARRLASVGAAGVPKQGGAVRAGGSAVMTRATGNTAATPKLSRPPESATVTGQPTVNQTAAAAAPAMASAEPLAETKPVTETKPVAASVVAPAVTARAAAPLPRSTSIPRAAGGKLGGLARPASGAGEQMPVVQQDELAQKAQQEEIRFKKLGALAGGSGPGGVSGRGKMPGGMNASKQDSGVNDAEQKKNSEES